MTYDKKKRDQPSNKRREQKRLERMPRPNEAADQVGDRSQRSKPGQIGKQGADEVKRGPGVGLDKSDDGVIPGSSLAGKRFSH